MSVFSNDDSALSIREDKARRNSQEALNFLVNDYRSMASIMRQYYPLAILSRAAWRCYEVENGHRPDELALARARILPMLLQSIFTSRYYDREGGFSSRQEILTKDWHRLETLADDAVRRLVRLIECRAVLAVKEGHVASSDFVAYRERLFLQLFPILICFACNSCIHVSFTKHQPIDINFRETPMNGTYMIVGRICLSVEYI